MQNSNLSATLRAKKSCLTRTHLLARFIFNPENTDDSELPSVSPELSYPEGVERLIGQGWREATTLSACRIECI